MSNVPRPEWKSPHGSRAPFKGGCGVHVAFTIRASAFNKHHYEDFTNSISIYKPLMNREQGSVMKPSQASRITDSTQAYEKYKKSESRSEV